jgi:cytochrome c553
VRTEVKIGVTAILTMMLAGFTAAPAAPAAPEKPAAAPAPAKPATPGAPAKLAAASPAAQVEQGKHLVAILGCIDCHTPMKMGPAGPAPDMTRLLSGHPETLVMPAPPKLPDGPWTWIGSGTNTAYAGPWGISYAANLTPEETTGLGSWNEDMFLRAIKQGKHWGEGRTVLPPMPWQTYSHLSDAEVKAIWAYLQTIPPISNNVPASEPAGPPPAGAPKAGAPTAGSPSGSK